jgi:radical SAM protein with 4Fe4S-binding SPASM domain
VPPGLLLQWHITERCNLRCAHCYQEGYGGLELDFAGLLRVVADYKSLLAHLRREAAPRPVWGQITVTGGEPFVRADFLDLLAVFASEKEWFSFAILSNGSLIDAAMVKQLRQLAPRFVQVSLEGSPTTHDRLRGTGSFARATAALDLLRRAGIPALVSFTAHRGNFREFPAVADAGRKHKATRVWADRLIPCGSGAELRDQVLTPDETREFFALMRQARNDASQAWFGRTEVAMHRALQFLAAGGRPYRCQAGDGLLTVMHDGTIYPCRRLPIWVGNSSEQSLAEVYYGSEVLRQLRHPDKITKGCHGCFYAALCRGGLRCLAYAVNGDPFTADPGCPLASRLV